MKYINAKQILTEMSLRHWVVEELVPKVSSGLINLN